MQVLIIPWVYILTVMWWFPEGYKFVPGIVLFATVVRLILIPLKGGGFLRQDSVYNYFLLAIIFYVTYEVAIYFLNGDSWREIRAMLAMSFYAFVCRDLLFKTKFFWIVVFISAVGFIFTSWWLYFDGAYRVGGFINPIPYATALSAVFMMVFSFSLFEQNKRSMVSGYFLASLLFLSLLMTQSRGVIGPTVLIALGMAVLRAIYSSRMKLAMISLVVGFIVLVGGIYVISSERLQQTSSEIEAVESGATSGSISLRLQMWSVASKIWTERPLLGWGRQHSNKLEQLYKQGQISQDLYRFDPPHYHNQYLDILVKKGGLGLVLYAIMILSAASMTWRNSSQPLLWGGISILLLYFFAGMTDVPFRHPATIYMFFCLLIGAHSVKRSVPRGSS